MFHISYNISVLPLIIKIKFGLKHEHITKVEINFFKYSQRLWVVSNLVCVSTENIYRFAT